MAALLAKARVLLAALSMGKAALVDVKSVLAASLVVLARVVSAWVGGRCLVPSLALSVVVYVSLVVLARVVSAWVGRRRLVLILAAEMDWEETVYDIRSDVGTDREF